MKLSKRMSRLGTETAFEVLAKARALEAQGREIIHLEIGEPDFDTPLNVVEAGVAALAGTCFGTHGEGFIRFSYANSEENLRKALERVGDAVAKL